MAAPPQRWTLKIDLQGEVRRLRDWPENGAEPKLATLRSSICGLFDLSPVQEDALKITYQDDEGDHCTLVEATLIDALALAKGVLRLRATCIQPYVKLQTPLSSGPQLSASTSAAQPAEPVEAATEYFVLEDAEESAETSQPLEANLSPEAEADEELADASQPLAADPVPPSEIDENARETIQPSGEDPTPAAEQDAESRARPGRDPWQAAEIASLRIFAEDVRRESCSAAHHVAEQLSDVQRLAQERLENARPHLAEGITYIRQQATDDVHSTCKDVQDAFGARGSTTQTVTSVVTAVGAVAGMALAATLAARRPARLAMPIAALGVAAFASGEAQSAPDTAQNQEGVTVHSEASDFQHLQNQVKNDIDTIRKDVSTALNCFLGHAQPPANASQPIGTPDSNEPAIEQDNLQQQQRPCKTLKTEIPAIASSLFAVALASGLAPLRVARFASANLAGAAAVEAQAEAAGSSGEEDAHPSEVQATEAELGSR